MKNKKNMIITLTLAAIMLFVGIIMVFNINLTSIFASDNISVQTLNTMLDEDYQFVDIRTSQEYNAGHIDEFNINIDFYQFENNLSLLDELDKQKTTVIICNSGNRTNIAYSLMKNYGFKQVYNVLRGIQAWWSM